MGSSSGGGSSHHSNMRTSACRYNVLNACVDLALDFWTDLPVSARRASCHTSCSCIAREPPAACCSLARAGVGLCAARRVRSAPHVLIWCHVVMSQQQHPPFPPCLEPLHCRYDRVRHPLRCVRDVLDDMPELYDRSGRYSSPLPCVCHMSHACCYI